MLHHTAFPSSSILTPLKQAFSCCVLFGVVHLAECFTFLRVADIECGGGFYVRSLVDDLGKGETTFHLFHLSIDGVLPTNAVCVLQLCPLALM